MDYRELNRTSLRVSRLCFGTMTFGKPVDQAGARGMLDRCIGAGINFVDTANVYQDGEAETLLGAAMRGKRDKLIVASKIGTKWGDEPDRKGLSKRAIMLAAEKSLQRLQTDYLDIYYMHLPDYDTEIEESMEAMQFLVQQGKVRTVAASNFASWQVCQMHWIAERRGYRPPSIAQQMYNLLARGLEQEFLPMAKALGVSTIAYNPLAGGMLTGKHRPEAILAGGRFDSNAPYQDRYWHAQDFKAVEQLKAIAANTGRSLISLSLNWLLHHTGIDCVILGASSMDQLVMNLAAASEGPLPPEAVTACDAVWKEFRGPAPIYNR